MIWLGIYIVIAWMLTVFAVVSRKEKLLTEKKITGVEKIFRKMAVYLYRKGRQSRFGRKEKKGMSSLLTEKMRGDITILNPSAKPERELAKHRIQQIQTVMTFLAAADVLAIALWISDREQRSIQLNGAIERPGYEESSITVTAKAEGQTAEGKVDYGEYDIVVGSRKYTKKEADKLAGKAWTELEHEILGENQSLSYVTQNLNLVKELDSYPFRISWESSSYEIVDTDGTVFSDQLKEGEHQSVCLTATLAYEENSWSKVYELLIFPRKLSEEERYRGAITDELEQQDEDSKEQSEYFLPAVIGSVPVQWTEVREESSPWIFILILGAGAVSAYGMDQELHKKVRKRDRELALDYPLIISKMTLYLGAGMSIRNIFYRLGEDYQTKCRKGGRKRYVYEEIILVCRELDSGMPETSAYAEFGRRCHSRQYAKLSALLASSQTKGNSGLLKALQEEADQALEERKGIARQMGEEAGTKLLLPMLMMLGITLVIIMIPAYLSFSL